MDRSIGIRYCCHYCRYQDGCNRGACEYAHGSHNHDRHRSNGDCEIANMVCYSWHPGEPGGHKGRSRHSGCWVTRIKAESADGAHSEASAG